jgi:hypothetical protein
VAAYHEAGLARLVDHVGEAIDGYRRGELGVAELDELLHQYQKAARELWKFCWLGGSGSGVELVAHILDQLAAEGRDVDWWSEAGGPSRQ